MNRAAVVLVLISLSGCAGVQSTLKLETIQSVKTIAIATEPAKRTPQILDHTKIGEQRSATVGAMFGLVGALVEGAVISAETSTAINESLAGERTLLTEQFKDYQIDQELNANLEKKISSGFTVIKMSDLQRKCAKHEGEVCSMGEYVSAAKDSAADALVFLRYYYGLAGYKGQPANAAVDADMIVYDLKTSKMIFRKQFSSDEIYNHGNTIDAFVKDDGALLKEDMEKAIDAAATLTASQWGLFGDEIKESRKLGANSDFFDRQGIPVDTMSVSKVDCKNPAKIELDCSGLTGPKKRIKLGKIKTSMGGSSDGKIVMLMYGDPLKALLEIKDVADKHNIAIQRATKFVMGKEVQGYILYTDGDFYTVLKEYSY